LAREHRGFARFDDVLRAAHRIRRIGRDDLARDPPVEQHANGGQVLLDRRFLEILAHRLDIGRDVQRLDIGDLADLVMVAPGEEPRGGPVIGHAGIFVADGGGEELEEVAGGLVAGGGDHARHQNAIAGRDRAGFENLNSRLSGFSA
jgi:hypothetical protein